MFSIIDRQILQWKLLLNDRIYQGDRKNEQQENRKTGVLKNTTNCEMRNNILTLNVTIIVIAIFVYVVPGKCDKIQPRRL